MNAVQKIEPRQEIANTVEPTTLLSVISRAAADPGTDIDKMERLMAMYERAEARRAEQEFHQAMTRAQGHMRRVEADATNPQTRSRYATYAALDRALRPIYSEEGFSLSFDTADSPKEDHVRVVCYVAHSGGFSRSHHVDMPADGKGAKGGDVMTKTHAAGAAMSYGMRYLLKMIWNVAIGEDDDDGNVDPHQQSVNAGWLDKIAGIQDEHEGQKVRAELKESFAGTPPRPLVAAWQARMKQVAA